jgi:hypothetical protein
MHHVCSVACRQETFRVVTVLCARGLCVVQVAVTCSTRCSCSASNESPCPWPWPTGCPTPHTQRSLLCVLPLVLRSCLAIHKPGLLCCILIWGVSWLGFCFHFLCTSCCRSWLLSWWMSGMPWAGCPPPFFGRVPQAAVHCSSRAALQHQHLLLQPSSVSMLAHADT